MNLNITTLSIDEYRAKLCQVSHFIYCYAKCRYSECRGARYNDAILKGINKDCEPNFVSIFSLSVTVVRFKPLTSGLGVECSTTVLPGNT